MNILIINFLGYLKFLKRNLSYDIFFLYFIKYLKITLFVINLKEFSYFTILQF